jgi:large subunit ribosomal protein L6
MKKFAEIPEGIEVNVEGMKVTVKNKDTVLERDFYDQMFIGSVKFRVVDNKFEASSEKDKRKMKSFVGSVASHVRNMITGIQNDYTYKLKICYVHFPMTAKVDGDKFLITNFLGEKQSRIAKILDGVKVQVKKDDVTVISNDKEKAGQTAANIENATRVTSRDRRIYQDGIFITEKAKVE